MNQILQNLYPKSDLENLRSLMDSHFGAFFKKIDVSLDDHLILSACAVIEYLIYFHGDTWMLQLKLRSQYPEVILDIVKQKFHAEIARVESAEQKVAESDLEIKRLKQAHWEAQRKNDALTTEVDRLQKVIDQQNQVLRNLQDRLDCVSKSGQ